MKTHLHRGGPHGGHVLFPFASHQERITNNININKPYVLDTSKWSSYRFSIISPVTSLAIGNPTVRSVSAPLFLEFVNRTTEVVTVTFDNEFDVGGNLVIPPPPSLLELGLTKVTGILLLEEGEGNEGNKWIIYSPWTCNGAPLPK